jgi:hypothetical protein
MFGLILSFLGVVIKPVFEFLNRRVEAAERIHVSDNAAIVGLGSAELQAQAQATEAQAQVRLAEGKWSPWVLCTIWGFMLPFGWHTWQVVLDSSAWHIALGSYYWPYLERHIVGAWKVAALPGMWSTTEHAVIQSLFIGAGVSLGAAGIVKAIRGR